ncbi:MAG: type IV toxin-antitoxin system AbiEi family antitoxin domain-containing protein [Caulobacteraceae bacterium]
MAKRLSGKLNSLERSLPQGVIVDAAWLSRNGYSTSLRSQYVSAGWLEQPARRVYRRPSGALAWQYVVISLQTLLQRALVVGGRTALELHGYAHYLAQSDREVHLYGPKPPPSWLHELPLDVRFRYHNSQPLFGDDTPGTAAVSVIKWGAQEEWRLTVSPPERAILELLDELPNRESFHQADMLMEGLTSLSPRRLQELLVACRSVKVKRLFFFFADRHHHRWLKQLDKTRIDFGQGKRMLVRGGKLDHAYQITVPEALHGVS